MSQIKNVADMIITVINNMIKQSITWGTLFIHVHLSPLKVLLLPLVQLIPTYLARSVTKLVLPKKGLPICGTIFVKNLIKWPPYYSFMG